MCDGFAREHARGPMVVPVGNGAIGDGDEVGLLRATQRLATADLPLMAHHRVHATFCEAGTDVEDSSAADVEGPAHLDRAPTLTQLEHDQGSGTRTGAGVAGVDEGPQAGAVGFGQHDLAGELTYAASDEALSDVRSTPMSTSFDAREHTIVVKSLLD
jgi:hypothetical protein